MKQLALSALLALPCAILGAAPALGGTSWLAGKGSANGQFASPTSIAADSTGRLIVADGGNSRVQILDSAGTFIRALGGSGSGPGEFGTNSLELAVGTDDDIYVIQEWGAYVDRFSRDGVHLARWGGEEAPEGQLIGSITAIATDAAGSVYIAGTPASQSSQQILKYNRTGSLLSSFPVKNQAGAARTARDLAILPSGEVVALLEQMQGSSIARYSADGTLQKEFANTNSQNQGADYIQWSFGVAAGPSGIYIAHVAGAGLFSLAGEFINGYSSSPAYPVETGWDPCDPQKNGYWPGSETGSPGGFTDIALSGGNAYLTSYDGVFKIDGAPLAVLQALPDNSWAQMGLEDGKTGVSTGQVATFYAGRSWVPFGSISRYEWDLDGDGTFEFDTGTTPKVQRAYAKAGSFTARVRVTGVQGMTTEKELPMVVSESRAILYPFGVKGKYGVSLEGKEVDWRGHFSEFACSPIRKYEWDLDGNGTFETDTGTTNSVKTTYAAVGKFTVSLRVTRPGGRVDVGTMKHEVRPAPPEGRVGVSVNDAAQYTNEKKVSLDLVWPPLATHVVVSNDGGFKVEKTFPLGQPVSWELDSSGSERLPKTVYIRFVTIADAGGEALKDQDRSYADDIILDETRPVVAEVTASRSKLRVKARDNLSGVAEMQVTGSKKRPGKWKRFKKKSKLGGDAGKLFVRVRDSAGNPSKWRTAERR